MSKQLHLIRHAESVWNAENRFTGHANIALTDHGIEQAYELKSSIEGIKFFRCMSSPLVRALHTANILSSNIEVHRNLIERDYGLLTGMNRDIASERFGVDQIHSMRRDPNTRPPNGESLIDVVNLRIKTFLFGCVLPSLSAGNIMIVAHGNSIRAIILALGIYDVNNISEYEVSQCKPVVLHQGLDGKFNLA